MAVAHILLKKANENNTHISISFRRIRIVAMLRHIKTPAGPSQVTTILIEKLSFRAIKETALMSLNMTGLITKHAPRCMAFNRTLIVYSFEEN